MAEVIAEIGINHNGDLDLAKKMILTAKNCGADYVKFQIRDVATVYAGELDKPRKSPWGTTQGEQKYGLEFLKGEYDQISLFCWNHDIPWFASFWDINTLTKYHRCYDWPYNKVASAMVTNHEFCRQLSLQKRPTIISTGGCTMDQICDCVHVFRWTGVPITIMHCVGQYPCPDELLNLRMLHTLKYRYPWARIGYSGHEVGLYPSVMAIAMGAQIVERHFTLDRSMYGSDQAASIEPEGLRRLCDVAHNAEAIFGDGKKTITPKEAEVMAKLRYWERENA